MQPWQADDPRQKPVARHLLPQDDKGGYAGIKLTFMFYV
jgi:hypothetical protein